MAKQPIGASINKVELDNLINRLSEFGVQITEKVADEIEGTTLDIETEAKMNLAAHMSSSKYSFGGLMASIHSLTDRKNLAGIAYTNKKYAPYIEFGTGGMVKVARCHQMQAKRLHEIKLCVQHRRFTAYQPVHRMALVLCSTVIRFYPVHLQGHGADHTADDLHRTPKSG